MATTTNVQIRKGAADGQRGRNLCRPFWAKERAVTGFPALTPGAIDYRPFGTGGCVGDVVEYPNTAL